STHPSRGGSVSSSSTWTASTGSATSTSTHRAPPPQALRRSQLGTALSAPTRSPLLSPRSPRTPHLHDAPSSPPPTSPLPALPDSPSPSVVKSPRRASCASKAPSDEVAEPTPDDVPPVFVPLFSPFLSPDFPTPPRTRARLVSTTSTRSSDAGFSDVGGGGVHRLFDSESDAPTSPLESSAWSEVSIATAATSIRSRASSVGKASLGSVASQGPAPWATRLETQLEEDEVASVEVEQEGGAAATLTSVILADDESSASMSDPAAATAASKARTGKFSLSASLMPKRLKRRPRSSAGGEVEVRAAPPELEHWAPSFFDTVRGGSGTTRNPLSTRKATAITRELVDELDITDLSAPQPLVSPPLVPPRLLDDDGERFVSSRAAPPPSFVVSSAHGSGTSTFTPADPPRSSTSSSSTRRLSLDPGSLALPRLFNHGARTASTLTRSPSTRSSASSGGSVAMDRFRSSSGGSASSADEAVTPLLLAGAFSPPVEAVVSGAVGFAHEITSASFGDSSWTGSAQGKSAQGARASEASRLQPLDFAHRHAGSHSSVSLADPSGALPPSVPTRSFSAPVKAPSLPPAVLPSSPPSISSSSSSSSKKKKPLSAKEQRHALEISVGTKVLEAAGASATEIRLRARSVGFQVLKQREDDAKKQGRAGKGAAGLGLTGALGEYVGGEALGSRFSMD
ncbi:hypothetical protein JCM8208_004463, partial [Rhodotorula glutinis]